MSVPALRTRRDAYALLRQLCAPERLLLHVRLVGEAADDLVIFLKRLGLELDYDLIELGVALHDAGKIVHPNELSCPGSQHEPAGAALLKKHGVPARIARCCITHAVWQGPEVSLEERIVSLADKLWKGKRESALEFDIIDEVARRVGGGRWRVFETLDSVFEAIAAGGSGRLERSLCFHDETCRSTTKEQS